MVSRLVDVARLVVAQSSPTPLPDLSPLAYWGIAGTFASALISLLLWLFLAERREHRALQTKVLSEFLPALVEATNALRHESNRPHVSAETVREWIRTIERVTDRLDLADRHDRDRDRRR